MTYDVNQASAIAAVRLLREAGEEFIAARLVVDLMSSDLFCDEPIVPTLRVMAGAA